MPLELERMVGDVKWAKAHRLPARELKAMLRRLVAAAPEGSAERRFARLELAAVLVESEPWLAARLARDALRAEGEWRVGEDDRALGVLGIAHMLLGNFRSAREAFRRAIEVAPDSAEHRHNLGHVLDVAFNRPLSALPHLKLAHQLMPEEPEIASSLAHALLGAGREAEALRHLVRVFEGDSKRAQATLQAWRTQRRVKSHRAK
ncbi:MAG TPA: tetratricopeptide repeat protein [Polyangiaceae bacterium]|nr:tetratricopeptide repeat protein [Polyangiaceae bacterium]